MPRRKSQKQKDEEDAHKAENERVVRQKLHLITLIRDYPSIYDKGHPQHLNGDSRHVIWENISSELGESGTVSLINNNSSEFIFIVHVFDKFFQH